MLRHGLFLRFNGSVYSAYIALSGAMAGVTSFAVPAQAAAPVPSSGKEIVVTAARLPGSVVVPQAPVATFDEEDIEAYGVTSITDLLDAISPETNSGRGRSTAGPIILVNGVRIASLRELRDFPPESIRRIEVFPEEVSLRFGYPPDQRVVNFILKDHFHALTLENEETTPENGGGSVYDKFYGSTTTINMGRRLNVSLETDHTTPLTEAIRQVPQTAGSVSAIATDPSQAAARTLVPDSVDYTYNATLTVPIGEQPDKGTLSINTAFQRSDATALSGLNTVSFLLPDNADLIRTLPGALTSFTRTDTAQAGFSLNKPFGNWQFSLTTDGTHAVATTHTLQRADTSVLTDDAVAGTLDIYGPLPAIAPGGMDYATGTSNSITSLATLIGRPAHLPGGDIALTVKTGYAYTGQISTINNPVPELLQSNTQLNRGDVSVGINLGIPITSRREGFGAALGDITLNISGGADWMSDAGWLSNWTTGVTWGVTDNLNLRASYFTKQVAPSLTNLGAPQIATNNVPIYDFMNQATILVTTLSGGNPDLKNESERDIEFGVNWSLPFFRRSTLIVEYFDNHSSNIASSFPMLTPEVMQAFPGRIQTDAAGNIVTVDEMPVNIAAQHEVRLRWGFNLFGDLGKALPPTHGGRMGAMLGGGMLGGGQGGAPADGGSPSGGVGGGGSANGGTNRSFGAGTSTNSGGGGGGGHANGSGGGWHGGGGGGGGHGANNDHKRYPGRWNVSIFHTVEFVDKVTLAPGFAPLDLLNGGALSSTGGVARHTIEVDAGGSFKGIGFRLGGTWTGPTHVDPLDAPPTSDLRFGALTKFNIRAFVDFSQQTRMVAEAPFLKGARLSLMVNNVLDSRQKVTDATGATPLSYSPYFMDPLGRVLGLEFRKIF